MGKLIFLIYKLIILLKDDNIKLYKKLLFLVPVIYLFSPITLVPYKFFPLAGIIENIVVAGLISFYLKNMVIRYDPFSSGKEKGNKKDKDEAYDLNQDDYEFK